MANEDALVSLGLDNSNFIKKLNATSKALVKFQTDAGAKELSIVLGVNPADAKKSAKDAFDAIESLKKNSTLSIAKDVVASDTKAAASKISKEKRVADVSAANFIAAEESKASKSKRVADVSAANFIAAEERKGAKSKRVADASAAAYIKAEETKIKAGAKESSIQQTRQLESATLAQAGVKKVQGIQQNRDVTEYNNAQAQSKRLKGVNERRQVETAVADQKAVNDSKKLAAKALSDASASKIDPNLPRLRYALYDISATSGQIASSLYQVSSAAITTAATYETAFTAVERTTGATGNQLASLRGQLIDLSTQIPLTFQDISGIAALGAQMGIATQDIAKFTTVVAEFGAVTNVSTDQAAQSFGVLGNLLKVPAAQFENLGSSIAFAGVKSAATETEILSVATQIGGVANSAGLSAKYVIGLSTALASLKVPAEQSRGALTRVFQEVNRAAAAGGPALDGFAAVLGVSAEQASKLASSDMGAFFDKFIAGLDGLNPQQLTTTLDGLNLSELRVTNTLTRLAGNMGLVTESMANASQSYEDGTFLADSYAKKVDDIASRFQILVNILTDVTAAAGDIFTPILGPILDGLAFIAKGFNVIANNPVGKFVVGFVIGIAALGAAIFGLISVLAIVVASFFAFRTAVDGLAGSGFILDGILGKIIGKLAGVDVAARSGAAGLTVLAEGEVAVGAGAGVATAGMNGFKLALISSGIGIAVLALGALTAGFIQASQASSGYYGNNTSIIDAAKQDTAELAAGTQTLADVWRTEIIPAVAIDEGAAALVRAKDAASDSIEPIDSLASSQDGLKSSVDSVSSATRAQTIFFGDNAKAAAIKMIQDKIMSDAGNPLVKIYQDPAMRTALANSGVDLAAFTQLVLSGNDAQAKSTIDLMKVKARALYADALSNSRTDARGNITFNSVGKSLNAQSRAMTDAANQLDKFRTQTIGAIPAQLNMAAAVAGVGDSATKTAADLPDLDGGIKDIGDSANGAAQKVRTLSDYASDLSSVWSRAFDIRFSGQDTLDKISSSFASIAKSTADARDEIQGLNADIGSLTADKALQEYFLTVAEAYGDSLAAGKIRSNIAKIDKDLASKSKSLESAQKKTNKTLVGSTDAAIDNRAEITGLVKNYEEHIQALADSGMSQEDLRKKSITLKAEFIAQATQLGYNSEELGIYSAAFDDVTIAINNVPRNVTVTANTNPALQALAEFQAKMEAQAGKTYSGGTISSPTVDEGATARALIRAAATANIAASRVKYSAPGTDNSDRQLYLKAINYWTGQFNANNYAEGGYTGSGGKYDVAGIVHKGEYVVPQSQVNQATQKPYFMEQTPQYFSGGFVGGNNSGGGMVSLSPEDRALLRNVGGSGSIVLYADGKELARSVNDGNRQIVASGGRP